MAIKILGMTPSAPLRKVHDPVGREKNIGLGAFVSRKTQGLDGKRIRDLASPAWQIHRDWREATFKSGGRVMN